MGTLGTVFKWTAGTVVIIGAVGATAGALLYPKIQKAMQERNQSGELAQVVEILPDRLVRTVSAPGELEPRTRVSISARVSALITELPFEDGDMVSAGDLVVQLDDKELQARLKGAQAQLNTEMARLEGTRAEYINATAEWERLDALYASSDISLSELDQSVARRNTAEANLNAAQHNVEGAQSNVDQAMENLGYTKIYSPIDGRVTTLNAEVGEIVMTGTMNNPGTVIMEIADLSEMLVRAEVSENDISEVRAGQRTSINLIAYPERTYDGTVELVSLQSTFSDQDRAKIYETEILLHLPEGQVLHSGLTANVDIEIETLEDVLAVPSQAVREMRTDELPQELVNHELVTNDKTFTDLVYVYDGSKAIATPVTIGESDLSHTSIMSGLSRGDRVIVGPWRLLQNLKHEQSIRLDEARSTVTDDDQDTGEQTDDQTDDLATSDG
ncbi:MAG: efflux RND transporter periplasmic adaptor subunit [Planctomycetota bacterium]|jgi:HlyD family secretion protein